MVVGQAVVPRNRVVDRIDEIDVDRRDTDTVPGQAISSGGQP